MKIRFPFLRALRGLSSSPRRVFAPAFCSAETNAAETAPPAIDQDASQAILQELKEIRRVLEKIERQGLAQPAQRPDTPQTASVSIGKDNPILGAPDAPVTVVEFMDYQCPYCKRFIQSTFPLLKRDFIDTGKVRWIVRDLPLDFHPNARKAAQAAHCAGEQGKFWKMRKTRSGKNPNLAFSRFPGYPRETASTETLPSPPPPPTAPRRKSPETQGTTHLRIAHAQLYHLENGAGDRVSPPLHLGARAPAIHHRDPRAP